MTKVRIRQVLHYIESNIQNRKNIGICIACGEEQDNCEPEARYYRCDNCGARKVFGAEELLLMLVEWFELSKNS